MMEACHPYDTGQYIQGSLLARMAQSAIAGSMMALMMVSTEFAGIVVADVIRVPADHATIQAAIDAAAADDIVEVEAGIYRERIQLKPGLTLRSVGHDEQGVLGLKRAEATIIDGRGTDGKTAGVVMSEGSILNGFTVTNVGEYNDALWQRHHATKGEEQSHDEIGHPGVPGIHALGISCIIENNIVHHNGSTGIAVQGLPNRPCHPRVARNICYRNMGGGIGSMQQSTAIIEGNKCFQNFYAGIGHNDASPLVLNNDCFENIRAGIGISEGASPIVRGNRCYRNRRAGIGTRTGTDTRPIIEDNNCYENDMAGIGAEEHAAPIIRNNRCWKNELAGIGSRTHASPVIIGNECFENEHAGIGQESNAATMLIGNHCHHNKAAGIGFAECLNGRSSVINNRLIDNEKVAIGIHGGWTVHLTDNELSRQGGMPPLVMVFADAEATFSGNRLQGGGVAGIRVAGTIRALNNRFNGTAFRKGGPPNFAIWALPGSSVVMSDNEIDGWRHGLHATDATIVASGNTIRGFADSALVIHDSPVPANVFDNTAISDELQSSVLVITGKSGIVANNAVLEAGELVPQRDHSPDDLPDPN